MSATTYYRIDTKVPSQSNAWKQVPILNRWETMDDAFKRVQVLRRRIPTNRYRIVEVTEKVQLVIDQSITEGAA